MVVFDEFCWFACDSLVCLCRGWNGVYMILIAINAVVIL